MADIGISTRGSGAMRITVVLLKILLSGCPLGKLDWRMLKNLLPTRVVQFFENGGLNHNIFLCLLRLFLEVAGWYVRV